MKKTLFLLGFLVITIISLSGQTSLITGTVSSAIAGEGIIPGVTVQVKGTSLGAVTDAYGRYSINVPADATILVFSFIGMKKQEIDIAGRAIVDVTMEYDLVNLQEILVTTGYDIKRQSKSTSSLNQVIPEEKLNQARETNLIYALAGKAAGIQFRGQSTAKLNSGSPYVRLRGGSGFVASPKVIYVIDGTIVPNTANINPDDIESVSILSGPSATAILGSQGANGAIIMTSKKAKTGAGRSMGVELNSGFTASRIYILPKYQDDYAGGNSSDMYKYTYRETDPPEWKTLDGKYYHNYSDDGSWGPRMVGQEYIPWYAWYPGTKYTGLTARLVPQPDNARDFFNTGFTFNNSIAFNRVSDDFKIRALVSNITATGNLPETSLGKTSLALKASYNVTRKLSFAANINFITSINRGDYYDGWGNSSTGSFNSWFHRDLDMNILKELRGLRSPAASLATWNHLDPPSYDAENPIVFYGGLYWLNFYDYRDYMVNQVKLDNLFGDVSIKYNVIRGLDLKLTYRRQQNNSWGDYKYYSDVDESYSNSQNFTGYGGYSNYLTNSIRENYEALITFERRFDDFSINLNGGSDFFSSNNRSNSGSTVNGLNVRNLFSISNSKEEASVSFTRSAEKYRAVFLRGDVGYRDLLFGEFTLRNDWFSALPPGNNSVFSKSFGLSFAFSDLVKLPWLSFGKLRASWGEIPTSIGIYAYPGFDFSVSQYQWNKSYIMNVPDQIVDPEITGEVKVQKEAGIDLRFLKNRIGLVVTYWDGSEDEIPYPVTISGYSGYSTRYMNTGKIVKNGLDFTLNFKPLEKRNINWEINSNLSWLINNKVIKIADGVDMFIVQSLVNTNYISLAHSEGYDWGQLVGGGISTFNDRPVVNADGTYVRDPQKYFGSILPKITGGIQNYFRLFRNLSVSANIDFQTGGKFWAYSQVMGTFSGLTPWTTGLNDRGIEKRDPVEDGGGVHVSGYTDIQDYTLNPKGDPIYEESDYYVDAYKYFHQFMDNGICDPFVYDLTFIKFRELSIGYDFPVDKTGNLSKYIQGIYISLIAQNFWLIYASTYDFDPGEIQYVDGETGNLPSFRSLGINLKITF